MNREHAKLVYYEQIRRVVPLAAVLERYGVLHELKRIGVSHKGCCPIHQGTNRRQFVCDLQKNLWHCFGDCDRGGGAIEFVAAMERVDLLESARLIAGWFAITSTDKPKPPHKAKETSMSGGRPSHKVFCVDDPDPETAEKDEKGWWTRIGSAWPHKDGRGLNLVLQALPVGNRIVLREYTDEDHKQEEEKKSKYKKK